MPADFSNAVLWGFLALCATIAICYLSYIDYKKAQLGQKKTDPIHSGVILTLIIWSALFLAESVGYFESGWNKSHFYIHIILAFLIVGFYLKLALRKKALSYEKQKAIAVKYIQSEFSAGKFAGEADINWLQAYKVTIESDPDNTRGEVGTFIAMVKAATTFKVWVEINIYTGQLLHLR